jgi:hypothetical protein
MNLLRSSIPMAAALLLTAAAHAQTQTGFPFTDESLRYTVNWSSGLSLGDATFTAHHTGTTEVSWIFDLSTTANIPGFAIADKFHSTATGADLCSTEFSRDLSQGGKKTREKTTFDQSKHTAHRLTTLPADGGNSDLSTGACARDALTYAFYARRELGQGRIPQAQTVYFGGGYSLKMDYTGAKTITSKGKSTLTDHLVANVKGPKSSFSFEIFYARDAARTPLQILIPLPVGNLTVELAP